MSRCATWDLESYSEAGHIWDADRNRWVVPKGGRVKGLPTVGAAAYWEHPTADVLWLSYDLRDGRGVRHWQPGQPMPADLCAHIEAGLPLESHNAMFERLGAHHVLTPRYGLPPLRPHALRCSMATARVNSLPGALGNLGAVLNLSVQKDKDGKRLLDKFSVPRNPTKPDPRLRILPADDPQDYARLGSYCGQDVATEMAAADSMEPMTEAELEFWLIDQEINWRGMGIDRKAVRDCIVILEQALDRYGAECVALTGGIGTGQIEALRGWLAGQGVFLDTLDADAVADALDRLPPGRSPARRALELRALVGSASVKKLYAMENQCSFDNRLRNLIVHHGARTGRPTGDGPQPLNLPKAGPQLVTCGACARPYRPMSGCPWCGTPAAADARATWKPEMIDHVLDVIGDGSLAMVEYFFGDALLCISGCIRGMFVAEHGKRLIASDYSAIEAVVIAMLAGEQWRIEAFERNDPIYLVSASKITSTPLDAYLDYHAQHGEHHPDRQKIGKVAELGLGFGGWVGAWRVFDDSDTYTDDEVKNIILAWRDASPAIVEFWGGQWRGKPWDGRPELYGLEGAAISAIRNPGYRYDVGAVSFYMRGSMLKMRLPSGRELTYHDPHLTPSTRANARPGEMSISYMTWNSNPKYGKQGWVRMETFGGRLAENCVQAAAHDILRHAILGLRAAGYEVILHVYDEIVVEVPDGHGSIEEVERIMSTMPDWAAGWPVRASGGWEGRRYRKA